MTTVMLDDATILYGQRVNRYFYLAGIVLLTYDHLLTFQSEVRYIWTSGHRKASAWYLFVRYFALCANAIMFALAFGDIPAKEVMIEISLILRLRAMYSFDKRMMFIISAAAIIGISLDTWSIFLSDQSQDGTNLPGCHTAQDTPGSLPNIRLAGALEGV
ncbi:hypothetical protein B0H19DRAFT_1266742 [Mycena capillaripes]|nr:hypothetical protein B0H19DRAFT_1266742 [Mycena capillaripes]